MGSPVRQIPAPVDVMPLNYAPSDPFKASFINSLLEKVTFPGPHMYGYIELNFNPRICLKREPFLVGKKIVYLLYFIVTWISTKKQIVILN